MRIRAAAVLVLLARSAWAAPEPAPGPAPAAEDPDPEPVVQDEPGPEPSSEAEPAGGDTTRFGVTPPPAEMIRDNSLLLDHTRLARDAARSGNCEIVSGLSQKVRALDPTFHDGLFALDPQIAACRTRIVLREVRADPPPSAGRIGGEVLLGMVVGVGGALVGALLGAGVCKGGSNCEAAAIGGAYVGAVLTIPLGVQAVGAAGDETGSLGMTYLGSLLGGLGGALMLASGRDNIIALGLIFAPPLGATIGFNASRRYRPRRVRVTASLIDWSHGAGPSLGVPIPVRVRADDRTVTSVPLLGGTF